MKPEGEKTMQTNNTNNNNQWSTFLNEKIKATD
jgi:hypothetical protein